MQRIYSKTRFQVERAQACPQQQHRLAGGVVAALVEPAAANPSALFRLFFAGRDRASPALSIKISQPFTGADA